MTTIKAPLNSFICNPQIIEGSLLVELLNFVPKMEYVNKYINLCEFLPENCTYSLIGICTHKNKDYFCIEILTL